MSTPTLMTMDFGRDDVGETIKWVRYTDAAAELDRLRAECEGYKADAERYRWLRKCHDSPAKIGTVVMWGDEPDEPASAEELDAAIDAAMAGGGNNG